jgi:hypothetical protein
MCFCISLFASSSAGRMSESELDTIADENFPVGKAFESTVSSPAKRSSFILKESNIDNLISIRSPSLKLPQVQVLCVSIE